MQRRLINHRSHQYGRATPPTLPAHPAEPLRPVVLEVSLDTHFIDVGHRKLAAPPSVVGTQTIYEPSVVLEIDRKVYSGVQIGCVVLGRPSGAGAEQGVGDG